MKCYNLSLSHEYRNKHQQNHEEEEIFVTTVVTMTWHNGFNITRWICEASVGITVHPLGLDTKEPLKQFQPLILLVNAYCSFCCTTPSLQQVGIHCLANIDLHRGN